MVSHVLIDSHCSQYKQQFNSVINRSPMGIGKTTAFGATITIWQDPLAGEVQCCKHQQKAGNIDFSILTIIDHQSKQ